MGQLRKGASLHLVVPQQPWLGFAPNGTTNGLCEAVNSAFSLHKVSNVKSPRKPTGFPRLMHLHLPSSETRG
jgi:hypothetical protein